MPLASCYGDGRWFNGLVGESTRADALVPDEKEPE
jgi:hypothetical protein